MAERIRIRRDLAATWQLVNPILGEAEPGYESDTGKLKIGDGFNNWNDLVYFASLSLNVAGGLAQLDGGGLVPRNLLPPATTSLPGALAASDKVKLDSLGSAAYAASTAFANAAQGALADTAIQPAALSTALSSKADLVNGTVPAAQLPGFVDDVLEFANVAAFPATGEAGKLYISLATNRQYRWSGSTYVEINPSPGSTDAVPEGSVNLYFTAGRAAAAAPVQSVAGRTGSVTLSVGDVSGAVGTNDARLTDSREWNADTISQNEAETGTGTTRRAFTALRVRQAIAAWWSAVSTAAGRDLVSAVDAAAQRTALGLGTFAAANAATPPAIGGTTPAAGAFTDLSASASLLLPGAAPSVPAAGHVYRSTNTLRYRDSTGTERLILNAQDNLENLANAAVARSNLGAASTAVVTTSTAGLMRPVDLGDVIVLACSDETTDLATGTARVTFRMPWAATLTAVRLSVNTAPTGSALIADVNEAGVSVFSTRPQIDAGARTSVGSSVTPVISDSALAADAEITVDIDQVGSTIKGKGLKVALYVTRVQP